MKKLIYFGMDLLLCLSATLWTGCEKKPLDETGGSGGGTTEQRGNLEGVVTDKATGVAITQASVTLMPGDLKTLTDEKGTFSFSDIQAGTYKLQVSKTGYGDYTNENLVVSANGTVRTAIELEALALHILDTNGNYAVSVLTFDCGVVRGGFQLKNTGNSIVEWDIPKLAEDWISFNKRSGKLAPGASEKIELTVDATLAFGADKEAIVYIGSTVGEHQLKVCVMGSMVYVQGGTFMMGATEEQWVSSVPSGRDSSAMPVHRVTLDGFYICKFEVTQAQWEAVMGTTIEEQHDKQTYDYRIHGKGDAYPMYFVTWVEAVQFCDKLSEKTGKKFRLPTEAEWEYAARGGQHHDGTRYAGSDDLSEVVWWKNFDAAYRVGSKKPNSLGIYDMSGNVLEWCSDWSGDYSGSPAVNPQGPTEGKYRIRRGGAFPYGNKEECDRVSDRSSLEPRVSMYETGFRVVCEP
ncbi:MAG: SUMF1/EgtB/PvdO family nonheme iron enzyme [Bacteroidales bacterium]|nr:SUMF1/EgtB/PvdO family nonheme iron enzyme [Bacteroidales bacterium]